MRSTPEKPLLIGILGGGQLGMLLARQCQPWGLPVRLYSETPGRTPAHLFAQEVVEGHGWRDLQALRRFLAGVDVALLENEFIPAELLAEASAGLPVRFLPSLEAYAIFQDKRREKELARKAGVPTPDFAPVSTMEELRPWIERWGDLVLKTCQGGYDGMGNLSVDVRTPEEDIRRFLARGPCLAERKVSLAKEMAVVVARFRGTTRLFPLAETIQHDHICHQVLAPARLSPAQAAELTEQAIRLVEASGGEGLFGLEFFLTTDGKILYNETAPRPHNSAHFTLDACDVSQFAAVIHMALGQVPPPPRLRRPCAGMLNLLGTQAGPPALSPLEAFTADPDGALWLYGKSASRPGRKMGHYTLLGEDASLVLERLTSLQRRYSL